MGNDIPKRHWNHLSGNHVADEEKMKDTLDKILAEFNERLGFNLSLHEINTDGSLQIVIDHACARGRIDLAKRFVECGRENGFNVGMPA